MKYFRANKLTMTIKEQSSDLKLDGSDEDGDADDDLLDALTLGRPAMTSAEYSQAYHQLPNPPGECEQTFRALKDQCSMISLSFLQSLIPALTWLPGYQWKRNGISDLVSGFTVAIMHIPQGMAYGMLAGVDPVIGIYTAFFPVILYAFLGNMPHVSMGTFAVVSILVSGPVNKLGQGGESSKTNGDESVYNNLDIAVAVTFCVGIIQTVLGIIRLGSLTVVITDVIVSSFTVGASFHVLTSQVKHILGLQLPTVSGSGRILITYFNIGEHLLEVRLHGECQHQTAH